MKTDIQAGFGINVRKSAHYPTRLANDANLPPNAPVGAVMMRNSILYVFDNNCWIPVSENQSVSIELDYTANDVLLWARRKMEEERKEAELLEKFPALKKAKEHYLTIKSIVSE